MCSAAAEAPRTLLLLLLLLLQLVKQNLWVSCTAISPLQSSGSRYSRTDSCLLSLCHRFRLQTVQQQQQQKQQQQQQKQQQQQQQSESAGSGSLVSRCHAG